MNFGEFLTVSLICIVEMNVMMCIMHLETFVQNIDNFAIDSKI